MNHHLGLFSSQWDAQVMHGIEQDLRRCSTDCAVSADHEEVVEVMKNSSPSRAIAAEAKGCVDALLHNKVHGAAHCVINSG